GTRLGFRSQLRFPLGAGAGLGLRLRARLHLGAGERLALLAQAILELGARREARLLQDLRAHFVARLLLELVPQQLLHLGADARLDLFLEPLLELLLRAARFLRLPLHGGLGLGARLGERLGLGFRAAARLGERARFLLRLLAQLRDAPALGLFLHLLVGREARLLLGERLLARFLLAHLRVELGLRPVRRLLRAARLLHRLLLGLGLGPRLRLELGAVLRLGLRAHARLLVRLLARLALRIGLFLLAHQLADVVRRARDHALRGGGHLARRGEVEVVFAGERIGLFLAHLEDAGEAVLGEGVERLLERVLVEVGLLHDLAEVRLAVDELEDLHQVLRERSGFLVDLRDALGGLREYGGAIHRLPAFCGAPLRRSNNGMDSGRCGRDCVTIRQCPENPARGGRSEPFRRPSRALARPHPRCETAPSARDTAMRSIAFFLLSLAALAAPALAQEVPGRVGRVAWIEGDVALYQDPDRGWEAAYVNSPFTSRNSLWTDSGARAEAQVGPIALRLDELSQLDVSRLDDDVLDATLEQGVLAVRVHHRERGTTIRLSTQQASFTLDAEGRYRLDADPDRAQSRLSVFSGSASLQTASGRVRIRAGQSIVVWGEDRPSYAFEDAYPTEFDRWAEARDERWVERRAPQYVSFEMTGYEDLDQYGEWSQDAVYGAVWFPTRVQEDWAPYRYGRWTYLEPWGWTWVDTEPWGYAPFHYGRWVQIRDRWAWCPGRRVANPTWAPALVGFIGGSGWSLSASSGGPVIGWYPLAPSEPYRPWYRASRSYETKVNAAVIKVPERVAREHRELNRERAATA